MVLPDRGREHSIASLVPQMRAHRPATNAHTNRPHGPMSDSSHHAEMRLFGGPRDGETVSVPHERVRSGEGIDVPAGVDETFSVQTAYYRPAQYHWSGMDRPVVALVHGDAQKHEQAVVTHLDQTIPLHEPEEMTLQEYRERRKTLRRQIVELITEFEQETGAVIEQVKLKGHDTPNGGRVLSHVTINDKLNFQAD